MKRLGEINISGTSGSILEKVFQNLPKSAPQLYTLTLRIGNSPLLSRHYRVAFTINEDLFCDAEGLQCVDLVNCNVSWDSRFLIGLARLTVHDSLKDNATSSIIQFLHALQRMPALTYLNIKDSIPDDSGGLSTSTNPFVDLLVDLSYLRVLHISSGVGALTTVLRHITFPSSARLNLTCRETQSTKIDFSNFLSVLTTRYLSSLVIRCLTLRDSDITIIPTCLVWNIVADSHDQGPAQLELGLAWPPSLPPRTPENFAETLTAVFDVMNLSTLTELHISTRDRMDSKIWLKTFGNLPLLERVHISSSYAASSFLKALVHKTEVAEKLQTPYRNVSLPKLRYIHLGVLISMRQI